MTLTEMASQFEDDFEEREAALDLKYQQEEIRRDQQAKEQKLAAEEGEMRGQLKTAEAAFAFILSGNAYFTVRSKKTGVRFTFRIATPKRARQNNERFWYVSLLNGPDNESNYTYAANLKQLPSGELRMWHTDKTRVSHGAPSMIALNWVMMTLATKKLPSTLEIWHEGRCGRCGRKLTVPESVERGIGPECAERMAA